MASSQQHRCVFGEPSFHLDFDPKCVEIHCVVMGIVVYSVGNIPYDATEEQLIQICEEVGPVVSFRLVDFYLTFVLPYFQFALKTTLNPR